METRYSRKLTSPKVVADVNYSIITSSEFVKQFRLHSLQFLRASPILALVLVFLFTLSSCKRKSGHVLAVNYVSAVQATLRDQVATINNKVGTVKNGDRVEVLEHEKKFSRVRTVDGVEGWIEQRYLVDQQVYDAIQKLTLDNLKDPVQASSATTSTCTSPPAARLSICTSFPREPRSPC